MPRPSPTPSDPGRPAEVPPRIGPWGELALDLASWAVVAASVFVAVATFQDYGITWDEWWHHTYGKYILAWYRTGFSDPSALTYRGDYLYGGAFDALAAWFAEQTPLAWYDAVHLFGALVGALGLAATWYLGRTLGGAEAGFYATVLLAATSVYHGHTFNNPKDVPFAAGYAFAVAELVATLRALPRVPLRRWLRLGVAAGLAMSVRVGGLLVLCYLLAAIAGYVALLYLRTGHFELAESAAVRMFRRFLLVWAVAWGGMLVFWPWAQLDPIRRPFFALGRMTKFNLHVRHMPFGDREIVTYDVPWDYLLRYFSFKLPELLLVSAAVGVMFGAAAVRRRWRRVVRGEDGIEPPVVAGVVALALAFPPLWAVAVGSTLYDGLRHFLFLVPMLAAVAGWGLARLAAHLAMRRILPRAAVGGLLLLAAGREVAVMRELHPHEYVYFNRIAGGLPGVLDRYDTDYYGNGYREAFERLRNKLWETDPEGYGTRIYRVGGCIPRFVAENYLRSVLAWREPNEKHPLDFFLGYQRNKCFERHRHRPIFTAVERQGTPIVIVRDMRRVPQPAGDGPGEGPPRPRVRRGKPRKAKARGAEGTRGTAPRGTKGREEGAGHGAARASKGGPDGGGPA